MSSKLLSERWSVNAQHEIWLPVAGFSSHRMISTQFSALGRLKYHFCDASRLSTVLETAVAAAGIDLDNAH